jgi:uncharacterized damage-inducible protein DinB
MQPLRTMFQHHAWATLTLIDHCKRLSPEQLGAAVPGTRSSILTTLVHLVAADGRYQERITGARHEPRASEREEPPSLDELAAIFRSQVGRWYEFLDRADDLNVTMPAEKGFPEVQHAEDLLFLQAIHHGNDHRTHICTILGASGAEVPELDGWDYWRAERA